MAKIGVFDSGYGGLTILEAIRRELPQYDYLYLGDNARAPYGTHSFDVIYRYNGEHRDEGADYFIEKYLNAILDQDPQIDTLILGCTHYPLLLPKIAQWIRANGKRFKAGNIQIISQGYLVAHSLADYLTRHPEYASLLSQSGTCHYLTTENADRFSQSASLFLSSPVQAEHIDL